MAKRHSVNDEQTNYTVKFVYSNLSKLVSKLTKTAFADIIDTSKQNLGKRLEYDSKLYVDELELVVKYLEDINLVNNEFYNLIAGKQTSEDTQEDNSDMVDIPVRGEVSISCGYGVSVYNDNPTGTCKVSSTALRQYGANARTTEIVYAMGDSMSPEIESGDALLVDTSQINIINGVVYAFNYDGQPMCKRLQKIGDDIKAISKNTLYDPFIIDKTIQFNIIGRVVGLMRPII